MDLVFSTHEFSAAKRFEAWREGEGLGMEVLNPVAMAFAASRTILAYRC
jgi:hypothetical protein